jgi:hypothetical protein
VPTIKLDHTVHTEAIESFQCLVVVLDLLCPGSIQLLLQCSAVSAYLQQLCRLCSYSVDSTVFPVVSYRVYSCVCVQVNKKHNVCVKRLQLIVYS